MKHVRVILLLLSLSARCVAQSNVYNLNINNGLPSNTVYSTITDHLGYLWIATDKGVVKYNGYSFKIFTTQDGLPNNDVWQLIEDGRGRIWLGCIADRMGYIYNDKYHNAVFRDPVQRTIYPKFLSTQGNNIIFASAYQTTDLHPSLCIEKNDTIYNINIADKLKVYEPGIKMDDKGSISIINLLINSQSHEPMVRFKDNFYDIIIRDLNISFKKKSLPKCDKKGTDYANDLALFIGENIFFCALHEKRNYFTYLNILSGRMNKLDLSQVTGNEKIQRLYHNGSDPFENNVHAIMLNDIVEIISKPSVRINTKIKINSIAQIKGDDISSYINSPYWGQQITTLSNGIYLKLFTENVFTHHEKIDLSDFRYIGGDDDEGFWINSHNTQLYKISEISEKIQLTNVTKIECIRKIKKNEYILFGIRNYHLNFKTKKCRSYVDTAFSVSIFSALKDIGDYWYCISNFDFYRIDPRFGTSKEENIDIDRYKSLTSDTFHNVLWAYNPSTILIYNLKRSSSKKIHGIELKKFGVRSLVSICPDNRYGNIFIKGADEITMYDYEKSTYVNLFGDLDHKETKIHVYKNIFIVYGPFGIRFSKIYGKNELSAPIQYKNIKNINYGYIKDAQFSFGKAILSTDKGTFSLQIPEDDSFYKNTGISSTANYKLICYYQNVIYTIKRGDTIKINKNYPSIRLDVINPHGNGKITYTLKDEDSTIDLNANEYIIPSQFQEPDHYYTFYISVGDKVWKSKPIPIVIYIIPKWWQTKPMVKIIWVISISSIILLIGISALITRKLVLNVTKKRNLRMELELRSIYAQINPHFIFNSLNSALLLVSKNKTEEAYAHISKFSRLLRSYIKSSRNKMILLSDEIKNLTNYIDLQQVRFKDKFLYQINISPSIDANVIAIPSLLLQPFVENAIEHGLLQKEETGHLIITFKKGTSGKLFCIIDDDGIGRTGSKLNKIPNPIKDESYGELLIKDLVTIFNKYEHMDIYISYEDKVAPLTGTMVTIEITINRK